MFDGKVDREIYLFPTSSRLPLITTPSPSPSRIITHRCRNNLIICRADDRSRILLVKNVSPPLLFPLRAEIGRSISMFPPRHFSHPSRNVDNFVRFRGKAEWNFFYLFSGLGRTSIVKYLFHDWFSCLSILYSVLSFFLFGDGLNN